jgi:hypothetical protein
MISGPTKIFQCPNCNNTLGRGTLISGNSLGARTFSDGKTIAPMLPEFPNITKCSKCKTIFWLKRAKKIAELNFSDPLSLNIKYDEDAKFLTTKEYIEALDKKIYKNKDEEMHIRLRLWWSFNDRVRGGNELFESEEEKEIWEKNIKRLMKLSDPDDIDQKITLAELHRCLGDFKSCMKIINRIRRPEFVKLKSLFKEECEKQNTIVFLLS